MNNIDIIATIGPANNTKEKIRNMILAGANVMRLYMAEGSHEDHAEVIRWIREIDIAEGTHTRILGDLQGGKSNYKYGELVEHQLYLPTGSKLILDTDTDKPGNHSRIPFPHPDIIEKLQIGTEILMAQGKVKLVVTEKRGDKVEVEVVQGGTIYSGKAFHIEGITTYDGMTSKDITDTQFLADQNVDMILFSMTTSAQDIMDMRRYINDPDIQALAKVETPEGLSNIDDIVKASDGVVIGRGDLGALIGQENVSAAEERILNAASAANKYAVVATNVLKSFTADSVPSEPTDYERRNIETAISRGAKGFMLTHETSVSKHAVAAITALRKLFDSWTHSSPVKKPQASQIAFPAPAFNFF